MAQQSINNIPLEIIRLRLCASLRGCGGAVESCFKESRVEAVSVYDDETLGYSDWQEKFMVSPKVFVAYNKQKKNIVLLPLDNRIISGPSVKQGGVADCALLTTNDLTFIEFKTNVTSNTEKNVNAKTCDAIKQLWHTYDTVIKTRCKDNGIEISKIVNVDFFIVFNKDLDVTRTMASRLNYQMEFMTDYHHPLYFDNEKKF